MYHFVKINKIWYLKPECLQDVIDHFKKICGREFKEGFEDYNNNVIVRTDYNGEKYLYSKNHSSSHWRNAIDMEMRIKEESWIKSAVTLEERTYKDRIDRFNSGKPIYLSDGLAYYPPIEEPTYDEEVWKETLEYPYEYQYDDVRFIKWPGGCHWYAKCGNIDIVDKYGTQKWIDKSYAQEVAKKWCKCGGDWSSFNE